MGAPEREGAARTEPALPPLHPLRSRGAPAPPPRREGGLKPFAFVYVVFLVLSCLVLPFLVLFCVVLYCLVLTCFVLACLAYCIVLSVLFVHLSWGLGTPEREGAAPKEPALAIWRSGDVAMTALRCLRVCALAFRGAGRKAYTLAPP